MNNNRIPSVIAQAAAVCALAFSGAVHAALILPNVEKCGTDIQDALSGGLNNLQCLSGTVNTIAGVKTGGTYVASYHDEFLSYSIEALVTIQSTVPTLLSAATYGDWSQLRSGSGTVDIGVLLKANGGGLLDNPGEFPDATSSNTTGDVYVRTWGGAIDDYFKGSDETPPTLTVEDVVLWLSGGGTPMFIFDLADPQPGQVVPSIFFGGQVYLTAADGTTVLNTWAFDNDFDGEYSIDGDLIDPLDKDMVLAPKNVPVYIPGSGCNETGLDIDWCLITNSRGSGFPEFIAYAPTMDLTQYDETGNLFWGQFKIAADGGASEEIYLTKRVGLPTNEVPEPGALALLGLALAGLAVVRRSRRGAR